MDEFDKIFMSKELDELREFAKRKRDNPLMDTFFEFKAQEESQDIGLNVWESLNWSLDPFTSKIEKPREEWDK